MVGSFHRRPRPPLRNAEGALSRMNRARTLKRIDRLDPFAIVLRADEAAAPVVLQSARDADEATVAFHSERQRLKQCRVVGDLLLMRQGKGARKLLREPLPGMSLEATRDDGLVEFSFRAWNSSEESWDDFMSAVARGYSQYLDRSRRKITADQRGYDPKPEVRDPEG